MDPAVGHFLAGFLDGEAHFTITRQNAGTSLGCGMFVAARDDDADLLEWLADQTGVGHVVARPQTGNSAPQATWRVTAADDCEALTEHLTTYPLRARKAKDFEIWDRAIHAADATVLRGLFSAIRRVRAYEPGTWYIVPPFLDEGPLYAYLGGLVTAEGCLQLRDNPRLTIKMRADDRHVLEAMQRRLRFGTVAQVQTPEGNPQVVWNVTALSECWALSRRLEGHVRGRKARELEIWRAGIDEIVRLKSCGVRSRDTVKPINDWLVATRRYACTDWQPRTPPPRGRRCKVDPLEALRAWAVEEPGALSATRYGAARRLHPEWPTRNTIARRYGSWHAALVAAGLADRAAVDADRFANAAARTEARRAERREASRAALLDAVRRYLSEHSGEPPTATAFFTWRRETGLDIPTQATMYKLFDGGWPEVLRSAQAPVLA